MPGGLLHYQDDFITTRLIDYLKDFDFRIGTLESAIGDDIPFDEVKLKDEMNLIYSKNVDLVRVKEMGFNVVSIANNHVYDLGEEGLVNTINLLDNLGIKHCGAGLNEDMASEPAVVESNGLSIAFIACCLHEYASEWVGYVKKATKLEAGIYMPSISELQGSIRKAKKKYDYVYVLPHWGREHHDLQADKISTFAKLIIAAGADGVIGSHPHVINPVSSYNGKPIFFSLGNFLFPDFLVNKPRPIWYPKKIDDLNKYEMVFNFPLIINGPTISKWKTSARIGLCAEISIESESVTKTDYNFVKLSEDNILDCYTDNRLKRKIKLQGMLPSDFFGYKFIHKFTASNENILQLCSNYIVRRIKRLLK